MSQIIVFKISDEVSRARLGITFNLSYTDIFTLIVMLSDSQC